MPNTSLTPNLIEAVETLAENLLASEPFVAFEQAYARFEADPQASGLMRKLTQAQVDAVADAFSTIGVDPGTDVAAGLENTRTVAKLDWNISDNHRATFTYQRTKEAKPQPYSSYARDYSVILPSNWYNSASKTDNYSMQLFSDWTENFSTELKIR